MMTLQDLNCFNASVYKPIIVVFNVIKRKLFFLVTVNKKVKNNNFSLKFHLDFCRERTSWMYLGSDLWYIYTPTYFMINSVLCFNILYNYMKFANTVSMNKMNDY